MLDGIYKITIAALPEYRGTAILQSGRYYYTNNFGETAQGTYRVTNGTAYVAVGHQWRLQPFDENSWREMKFYTAVLSEGTWDVTSEALTVEYRLASDPNATGTVVAKRVASL